MFDPINSAAMAMAMFMLLMVLLSFMNVNNSRVKFK